MAVTLDLDLVRAQCRIDDTIEDPLLEQYIRSAISHVEMHCDRVLVEGEPEGPEQMVLTDDVKQAILMLVAHWAVNREAVVTGTTSAQVDLGVERLLRYRKRF